MSAISPARANSEHPKTKTRIRQRAGEFTIRNVLVAEPRVNSLARHLNSTCAHRLVTALAASLTCRSGRAESRGILILRLRVFVCEATLRNRCFYLLADFFVALEWIRRATMIRNTAPAIEKSSSS